MQDLQRTAFEAEPIHAVPPASTMLVGVLGRAVGLLAASLLAMSTIGMRDAGGQTYPDRVVRIVVPFSSGGVTDVVTRPLANRLSQMWGHQVVVDNRPGAGGSIGAEVVAKAKPDGYALLMLTNTHLVSAGLYRKLPYDSVNDFEPVMLICEQGSALVVHPSIPANTLAELAALARAQPKKLNYASSGNGSSQHLFAALAFSMAGVELTHVPYKGSGPAMTDLLSGLVPVSVPSISNALPHIRSGKLRALAQTGVKRSPSLPEVPTLAEAGLRGYDATGWFGIGGPKGLPPAITQRIHDSVVEAVRAPEVVAAYATQGIELRLLGTAEFTRFWRDEAPKWAKAVRDAGASVD